MKTIFEGFLLGITLSVFFSFGPALIALIQTSIHRGFWSGVLLSLGVFISDVALVGLGFLGAVQVFYQPDNQLAFGIIGGILLMIFGVVTFTRKVIDLSVEKLGPEARSKLPGPLTYILKGFFINFTNPFVWIFWMGVVVGFTTNYQGDFPMLLKFFPAALVTILAMDMLKCFSAYKIKKYFQTHSIIWINRIAGVGLCIFGIYVISRTLYEFYPG